MFASQTTQAQRSVVSSCLKKILLGIAPVAVGLGALPGLSQTPELPAATDKTVCTYDPDSGFPDPLGARASLTVENTAGDTAFIYERLPAVVSSDSSDVQAEVDNKRTLKLYETSLADARQLLLEDSTYYAALLGLAPEDPFIARGFERIDQTLTCVEEDTDAAELPAPNPPASTAAQPSVQ